MMQRRKSKQIMIRDVKIGGDAPISVQTMCNTDTRDVQATLSQINEFYEAGKNTVDLMIKTNIGEDEHELLKVASGGEMARIILAIKKVLADSDKMPIMIFDEIDTGISGKAAKVVAKKLKAISNSHQVICISHLAVAAALADYNYFISKNVSNERTKTNVKLLNESEIIREIARISAGEINEATLQYATELRNKIA